MMRTGQIRTMEVSPADMRMRQEIDMIRQKYGRTRDGLHMRPNNLDGIQRANLRSAIFDNVRTRPSVSENYAQVHGQMEAPPPYRIPLEHSVKPLPTLPYIVGNRTYNPDIAMNPVENAGTTFIRSQLINTRNMKPTLQGGVGEPSKTNPTVL